MRTKRLARLWLQMHAMFGSRWLAEYGDATNASGELNPVAEIWARGLDDCTNEQMAAGIKATLARDSQHPPTLPEFLRLCGARTGRQPADTRPRDLPALPAYSDTPGNRCAALARQLADEAAQVRGDADRRAWFMAKIGATLYGSALVANWGAQS